MSALAEELGWPPLSFTTEFRTGETTMVRTSVTTVERQHVIRGGKEAWEAWFDRYGPHLGPWKAGDIGLDEWGLILRRLKRELKKLDKRRGRDSR